MNQPIERQFKSLRVSLTQSCNLHCTYCVDPTQPALPCTELSGAKLGQAVQLLDQTLHLKRIKITGGEPLLGQRIDDFLAALDPKPNFEVSLTTNGQLLSKKLPLLQKYGVQRINISIDSLDKKNFKALTGGDLDKTLESLDLALSMGFKLKLNMVPMAGLNDHECLPMFEFAANKGIQLRYIELMEMGYIRGDEFKKRQFGLNQIIRQIQTRYKVQETHRPWGGTALLFEAAGQQFGVIANHSRPFCNDCDRLRLSSQGELMGCLSSEAKFPIKELLNLPLQEAQKQLAPLLHQAMSTKQDYAFVGSNTGMKSIGG